MKRNKKKITFINNTKIELKPKKNQPPKKKIEFKKLINSIFEYSATKNSTKPTDEYSTL